MLLVVAVLLAAALLAGALVLVDFVLVELLLPQPASTARTTRRTPTLVNDLKCGAPSCI